VLDPFFKNVFLVSIVVAATAGDQEDTQRGGRGEEV
jgi:hypothetical protein